MPMNIYDEFLSNYYDETFASSFTGSFGSNYQQAKQGSQEDYSKYANVAQKALAKAGGVAQGLSKRTGVPLPLATALVAAGLTGGPTAIPFAALLYFVKQPLMKGANRAFNATWDTGAKVAGKVGQMISPNTPKIQMQPEYFILPGSFKAFIEADTWGDWAGEKLGAVAGRVAGNVSGFGGKIASSLGNRVKEITQWAKGNPKELARMLFLVGAGAAIGAGVGKLTHEIKDLIIQKIKDQGIDPQVLGWVKQNIVLDDHGKSASGETLTSKGGQEVEHPFFIDPETGHKISGDQTISTADKMLKNLGQSDQLSPSDLHAQGTGMGRTIAVSSTGGTDNLTRVAVPSSPDLRDTYRDAARVLQGNYKPGVLGGIFGGHADRSDATNAMLQSSPTPLHASLDLKHYGHSSSQEIAKRIADAKAKFSLDTTTVPATIAGGVVGGTGNK